MLVLLGQMFLNQIDLLVLADCAFLNITMDYNSLKIPSLTKQARA